MTWPEINDASSLHRKAIRLAMSRGTPARRTGISRARSSFHSSGSRPRRIATARVISVSMKPGGDRVDRDAVAAELDRQGTRHALQPGLGGRVVGLAAVAERG